MSQTVAEGQGAPRDERLLSEEERSYVWAHNGGLGEYRTHRDREFLDALVWRGEQIDRLLAGYAALTEQIAAAEGRVQWSREVPTVVGWYWRTYADLEPFITHISDFDLRSGYLHTALEPGWWLGPLVPPAAPARATGEEGE